MGNIWLLKRALPFVATFAFGMFLASFFVSAGPRSEHRSYQRNKCRMEMRDLRIENETLREENQRLMESHDPMREFPVDPMLRLEDEELELPNIDETALPPPPPAVKSGKVHKR